jgi:Uma2 family endonuclease
MTASEGGLTMTTGTVEKTPPAPARLMTTEEMLALPDDGVERWLINGELREKPLTVRNRDHSEIMAAVTYFLEAWRRSRPEPRGKVVCGEAGVRLRHTPDITVGVDAAYISPEVAGRRTADTTMIDGAPILSVEILSPNDAIEEIDEKIDTYLNAGVMLVWVIHPRRRTVTVYRPGADPKLFAGADELTGEPHLPGLRVAVAHLFE